MVYVYRGDELRRARGRVKLTQSEVAERVRALGGTCTRATYSRWENSVRPPSGLVTICALSRVLRVSPLSLIDFEEAR